MKMNTTKIYPYRYRPNGDINPFREYVNVYYTKPFGYIEPNGMNFRNSVNNQNSRLYRMLTYINVKRQNGVKVTRSMIMSDVFNKCSLIYSRGWGTYLFSLSNKCGFTKMVRKGNTVYYTITKKGMSVIS